MADRITNNLPRHGGNLVDALKIYGGQLQEWIDLSTGISPWAYSLDNSDLELWRELPAPPDDLISAASAYYGCEESKITVSPGTQLAIRLLPTLLTKSQIIAVPRIGYQEHCYAWQRAGHQIFHYESVDRLNSLIDHKTIDHAVVINPNNPSCELISKNQLLAIAKKLTGVLIVDEAFADYNKTQSLVSQTEMKNIIVLRSIGKFFGLAGARVGFVVSSNPLAKELNALLQPWSINGPAQALATRALRDTRWQQQQTLRISEQSHALLNLFTKNFSFSCENQGLFTTLSADKTILSNLHRELAERHIWSRLGDPHRGQNWLRLSLPGDNFQRLSDTLESINVNNKDHD